jgi:hypothetical protein
VLVIVWLVGTGSLLLQFLSEEYEQHVSGLGSALVISGKRQTLLVPGTNDDQSGTIALRRERNCQKIDDNGMYFYPLCCALFYK